MEMLGDGLHSFSRLEGNFEKRVAQITLPGSWTSFNILAVRYRSYLEGRFPLVYRSNIPHLGLAVRSSHVVHLGKRFVDRDQAIL